MKTQPRILIVGSTGYLGSNIVEFLMAQHAEFKALARNKTKLLAMGLQESQAVEAQVTHPDELKGVCEGVDVVISCLGITRQQDGLGYLDVDYQANLNLLEEAERAGVGKFIYISAFNAQKYPQVRLLEAKERFASRLLQSTKLTPCVIRPNGFFSDITEVYNMAKSGRVFTFGNGENLLNPIHGKDLARFCVEAIDSTETEINVGGPNVFSVNQIAQLAFKSQNKQEKNTHLPDLLRRAALVMVSHLPEKWGGPAEFFLTMLGGDNIAPTYGHHRLEDYFRKLSEEDNI
ncbi:NAD dependent epimerase/dehydratase family protein [Vibrio harveyi]|uniref:NAD dependent epimerase/dehydratase family protein n=1 Tax=Vibrio harveyi TaxID=669 RepID=A0A454D2W2_VIBHA|nr:NAD dependent epimerase/dehydratase family protein [Vibrio harveyi]